MLRILSVLGIVALMIIIGIYTPVIVWKIILYAACTIVAHVIMFIFYMGILLEQTSNDSDKETYIGIIIAIFLVWNGWFTWFMFF